MSNVKTRILLMKNLWLETASFRMDDMNRVNFKLLLKHLLNIVPIFNSHLTTPLSYLCFILFLIVDHRILHR